MSVQTTRTCYIVPIFRVPGIPVMNPSIIARWHVTEQIANDASGGQVGLTGVFTDSLTLFQGHALWDLRFYMIENGSTNMSTAWLDLSTGERSTGMAATGGLYYSHQLSVSGVPRILSHYPLMTDFKWGMGNLIPPQVSIYMTPNTNGVNTRIAFGGYIYDERMI
jgi:hypothetical protein